MLDSRCSRSKRSHLLDLGITWRASLVAPLPSSTTTTTDGTTTGNLTA